MIATLVGAEIAAKFGRVAALALALAALLALAGLSAWAGARHVSAMVETARAEAIAARDAHWRGEIAAANAKVEAARADQAAAALDAQSRAQVEIDAARRSLADMEAANAALPDPGRCGLGRARVRLLPR